MRSGPPSSLTTTLSPRGTRRDDRAQTGVRARYDAIAGDVMRWVAAREVGESRLKESASCGRPATPRSRREGRALGLSMLGGRTPPAHALGMLHGRRRVCEGPRATTTQRSSRGPSDGPRCLGPRRSAPRSAGSVRLRRGVARRRRRGGDRRALGAQPLPGLDEAAPRDHGPPRESDRFFDMSTEVVEAVDAGADGGAAGHHGRGEPRQSPLERRSLLKRLVLACYGSLLWSSFTVYELVRARRSCVRSGA